MRNLFATVINSSALQSFGARIRHIPVLGSFSHKVVRRLLPAGTRVASVVRKGPGAGLQLLLDPRFEAQYADALYEPNLLKCLETHLRPGDVFYDIGGHIGFVTLVGARLVGPQGGVFAFEADPENAARILTHIQMNSLPQIELVQAAVWSESKTLSFHRAPGSSSRNTGSVADGTASQGADGLIVVEAVTLDSFAVGHRLPAVVKIDVEGAEGEVLKGAETVFRTSKPTLICEIHHDRAAENVAAWLASVGYHWKWLDAETRFPRHLVAQPNP
jgi:FkbM family methyltransferase